MRSGFVEQIKTNYYPNRLFRAWLWASVGFRAGHEATSSTCLLLVPGQSRRATPHEAIFSIKLSDGAIKFTCSKAVMVNA